jgi:hypothetical protein
LCSARERQQGIKEASGHPYKIKNRDFHHTLVEICRPVFYHFDGDNLLRFQVLALDNLAKCTLTENIENEIPVPGQRVSNPSLAVSGFETYL